MTAAIFVRGLLSDEYGVDFSNCKWIQGAINTAGSHGDPHVLPLLKKNDRIVETAKKLTADLRRRWYAVYDDTASIGRLYRRQDEVGTPFCVTVDVQTVGDEKTPADDKVTIRDRNTMEQVRVSLSALESTMEKLMAGSWAEVTQEYGIKRA